MALAEVAGVEFFMNIVGNVFEEISGIDLVTQ
jgi:hypothetical protein